MRRREFMALLGGAGAWVCPAGAQEPRRVIGYLGSTSADTADPAVPFVQGLKDSGFIEGKNLSIEWRWAEGQYNRLPSLAAELVSRGVAVIATGDAPAASAAKAATKTVPIVFATGTDPVTTGLVDGFSRPGGNLTGIFVLLSVLGIKRLELLGELVPSTRTFALLANPNNPNVADVPEIEAAANTLGRRLEVLTASTEGDLEAAFSTMVQHRVDSLIVMADPFLISRRKQLVALAARHAMPAIYPARSFVDLGGLMSYGSNFLDLTASQGIYVGKILNGTKPADLPVQQTTKFELVINLKTAKALALTIPPTLLARADDVIE
jgi:putative ABC transport system substrate-binding protein